MLCRSGDAGREESVINPATGETLGHIPLLEAEQIRDAVDATDRAFVPWRGLRFGGWRPSGRERT